jgi:pimeloyl-ACP methyl ester carboxylesterase
MSTLSVFKSTEAKKAILDTYGKVLALWPRDAAGAGPERLRVATSHGETAILAFGPPAAAKPPLIVLHGTGSNSSMWLGDAAALSRDRRVFAVDIPGEPGMSEELPLSWSGFAAADWLAELVAALGLREHDLLGLSIGGWIGLSYAIGRPEGQGPGQSALRSLALLCPSGIGRTRPSFMWKGMLAMARGRRGLESLSRSLYGDFPPPEEAIRIGTLMAESTNPRMETPRLFADEELMRIQARLFLAVGSKDALLRSKESAKRLRRLKPEAEILLLPGAGHALVGLGERVAAFLDRDKRPL